MRAGPHTPWEEWGEGAVAIQNMTDLDDFYDDLKAVAVKQGPVVPIFKACPVPPRRIGEADPFLFTTNLTMSEPANSAWCWGGLYVS